MTDVGRDPAFRAFALVIDAFTIAPPPRDFIKGITRRDNRTAAITFKLKSANQALSSKVSNSKQLRVLHYLLKYRSHQTLKKSR